MKKLTNEQIKTLKQMGCNIDESNYTTDDILLFGLNILSSTKPEEYHRCYYLPESSENGNATLDVIMFPKISGNLLNQGSVVFRYGGKPLIQCLYVFVLWCYQEKDNPKTQPLSSPDDAFTKFMEEFCPKEIPLT